MNTTHPIPEEAPWPGHPQLLYDVPGPPRPVESHLSQGNNEQGAPVENYHVLTLPHERGESRESNA